MTLETFTSSPDIELFHAFQSLRSWSAVQLKRLAQVVQIEQAPSGRLLVSRGGRHDFGLFLLDGWLRLKRPDGGVEEIRSADVDAREALARGLPEACDVVSVTPVRFFRLTNALLKEIKDHEDDAMESVVHQLPVAGLIDDAAADISRRLREALEQDSLRLPSLPEVAVRVTRALEDETSDAAAIAQIIQVDPAMTAKLIKAANSALYGRCTPVETCASAVVRLGSGITQKLIVSFALRQLFKSDSKPLQQRMWSLWKHSTRIAALCYLLARIDGRFDPEQAMLAGLIHDVGVIAVIDFIALLQEPAQQPEVVIEVIDQLRAESSAVILQRWGFAESFVTAAREAEQWLRSPGAGPDICDLVVVAQLHDLFGTEVSPPLPVLGDTPAYKRLQLGELNMEGGLVITDEMVSELTQTESLLNI